MTKRIGPACPIVLALFLVAPSALALCGGGGYSFGMGDWNGDTFVDTYFFTHTTWDPYNPEVTWFNGASWWGFGTGNPTIGAGNDNGAWQSNNLGPSPGTQPWLYPGYPPSESKWFATGGTDGGLTDGCPTGGPLVMMVADQAAGVGYFAVTIANESTSNATGNIWDFSQTGVNQVEIAIPKPRITASQRLSATQTQVTVNNPLSDFQGGYYPETGVTQTAGQVITGFKIYRQIVVRDAAAPVDRASGWTAATAATSMGTNATITLDCAVDSDAYLALSVVFEGATPFETPVVGPNSTKIQCGPTLAEPPRFKEIQKKPPRRPR